jgi:hypothetical protein
MGQIIKTKYYCKGTSRRAPGRGAKLGNITWTDRFVKDNWYEGTYELWYDDEERNNNMYRLNNKWRKYKVINESGVEEEISKHHMDVIFEMDKDEIRNQKIEQILKK